MDAQRTVIVTGASRGLGAAVARWLGQVGAAVIVVARSEKDLESVARDVEDAGGSALVVGADVSDPDACSRAVSRTLERFGRLDGLVNNAGVLEPMGDLALTDPEAFGRNLAVNVVGPFCLARFGLDALRRARGRIVNVSSGAARLVIRGAGAYCASKAALTHLTRVLADEEPRVTSVAVRPGVVDTRMQALLRREGPGALPPDQAEYYRGIHQPGRTGAPAGAGKGRGLAGPARAGGLDRALRGLRRPRGDGRRPLGVRGVAGSGDPE